MEVQGSDYAKYQKEFGFKEGDKVKLMSVCPDSYGGWQNSFTEGMRQNVGEIGTVASDRFSSAGIQVVFGSECRGYPVFCLVKVGEPDIKEMTLPEIIKELGYKVKIVE